MVRKKYNNYKVQYIVEINLIYKGNKGHIYFHKNCHYSKCQRSKGFGLREYNSLFYINNF